VIPGYLFVVPDPIKTFWEVTKRNIEGIANVVRTFSGDLAMLKDSDIDVIRSIERTMNTPVPGKTLHNFKTGDKVRFVDDNVSRWPPGRVAGTNGDGRIVVDVEVMGRVVPFQVFPHQVEKAG
jgi:transcription antitermination factor NusG